MGSWLFTCWFFHSVKHVLKPLTVLHVDKNVDARGSGNRPSTRNPTYLCGLWLLPYLLWHSWLRNKGQNKVQVKFSVCVCMFPWSLHLLILKGGLWLNPVKEGERITKTWGFWMRKFPVVWQYHFPHGLIRETKISLSVGLLASPDCASKCLHNTLLYWFFRFRYKLDFLPRKMRI